jgi:hypothetical protein
VDVAYPNVLGDGESSVLANVLEEDGDVLAENGGVVVFYVDVVDEELAFGYVG